MLHDGAPSALRDSRMDAAGNVILQEKVYNA
jgi:hypothetical protein